ncbi:PC4/YdbC family ssDNA-binding protein [Bacillota bacterium]
MADDKEREVTFELVEHIGVFGKDVKGWTRELNRVAWNGGPAKYDIRSWDEGHHKMGRGITLTKQELNDLKSVFEQVD